MLFSWGSSGFVHRALGQFLNAYAAKACPAQLRPTPSRCEKTTCSAQIYYHRTMDRSDIPRLVCRLTVGSGADGQRRSVHRAAYSVARRAGKGPARSFSRSVVPCNSSVTRWRVPLFAPMSCTERMLGCFSAQPLAPPARSDAGDPPRREKIPGEASERHSAPRAHQ
jgi:hypothetical protein